MLFRPAVFDVQPLHTMGVWLLGPNLGPLIDFLIDANDFVSRALADLYGDAWLSPSHCCTVVQRLVGVLLLWAGFLQCHPPDSCCASEKMVIHSRVVPLCETDPSARASAAHSAS